MHDALRADALADEAVTKQSQTQSILNGAPSASAYAGANNLLMGISHGAVARAGGSGLGRAAQRRTSAQKPMGAYFLPKSPT